MPFPKTRFFLSRDVLPSGAIYASDSNVSLHGNTELSSNYADSVGGKPKMTFANISAMPPIVEQ